MVSSNLNYVTLANKHGCSFKVKTRITLSMLDLRFMIATSFIICFGAKHLHIRLTQGSEFIQCYNFQESNLQYLQKI